MYLERQTVNTCHKISQVYETQIFSMDNKWYTHIYIKYRDNLHNQLKRLNPTSIEQLVKHQIKNV